MIDRGRYEQYDRAVMAAVSLMDAAVSEVCRAASGLSGEGLRQALSRAYPAIVSRYGAAIAEAACEFYADVRAAEPSLPAYEPQAFPPSQDGLLAWDVSRALAASDAASALSASARQRAMAYADETVVRNSQRDPAHPKWAVVPHAGACPWCVMLGSNGFQYRSRGSAGASRHPSCTCSVVADFDTRNPSLAGYDPGAMRDAWQSCRDAVEADARAKWSAMGAGERERYARRGSPSFDAYLRNRVVEEMGTRDRGWLQTGAAVETDYSLSPLRSYGRLKRPGDYSPGNIVDRGNEWRDLWAHHVLGMNGIAAQTHGKDDIDLTINGEWWEVKSPDEPGEPPRPGRELSFVEKNLRAAAHQFEKRGLGSARVVFNPRYRSVATDEDMVAEIRRRMRTHDVSEVLYINSDGTLTRITKRTPSSVS